jgi:hypothetical protein
VVRYGKVSSAFGEFVGGESLSVRALYGGYLVSYFRVHWGKDRVLFRS